MREGSTLIHALLPYHGDCVQDEPGYLPLGSSRNTLVQISLLGGMSVGFGFAFDEFAFGVLALLYSARFLQLRIIPGAQYAPDLLLTFLTYTALSPLPFVALAALAIFYQGTLFARHWIYISTAAPCDPLTSILLRARLEPTLFGSIFGFPINAVRGLIGLVRDPVQAAEAWNSYLNYGRGGLAGPCIFHSPSGSHRFRMHVFYCTGAAAAIGGLRLPFLGISLEAEADLAVVACLAAPAACCLLVPLLIVAPHFSTLRRIRDEAVV